MDGSGSLFYAEIDSGFGSIHEFKVFILSLQTPSCNSSWTGTWLP